MIIIKFLRQKISQVLKNRFHDSSIRVRVTDVAKLANCAPATVSRVINNPGKVSAEKKNRVEAAMQELGYVINHAARSLRSQRSHMVGILIPTLDYALYASLVDAANKTFSEAGISTLIATFSYDLNTEIKEAKLLLERGAEAIILVGQKHLPELYEMLGNFSVPFVNTYVHDPDSSFASAGFDNEAAAARVTQHLVHLGHTKFCVISGITRDNDRTSKRLEGIRKELSRFNVNLPNSMIIECPYTISNGRTACLQLISREANHPTAIICGNDVLALGALIECRSLGMSIPEDISIVGFDNLELSRHSSPPLTTIDVPSHEMGENAAQYILGKLNNEDFPLHNPVEYQLICATRQHHQKHTT